MALNTETIRLAFTLLNGPNNAPTDLGVNQLVNQILSLRDEVYGFVGSEPDEEDVQALPGLHADPDLAITDENGRKYLARRRETMAVVADQLAVFLRGLS